MFEQFSDQTVAVVLLAQDESRRMGHNYVGSEQVLVALLAEGTSTAAIVLKSLGLTLTAVRTEVESVVGQGPGAVGSEVPFTPRAKRIFDRALQEMYQRWHPEVTPEHLLLAITDVQDSVANKILENLGIDIARVSTPIQRALEVQPILAGNQGRRLNQNARPASKGSVLDEIGTDLTQLALEGKIDPVIGRQREIERVVQILGRRTKNNPILVGPPGVGKTAIAEGLAQRIVDQDVPELLQDKRVISLNLGLLLAGTQFRGAFEERLSQVLAEVREAGNTIVVIDEVHTLVGAGATEGGLDAANLLKPALARGELQCIGATTLDEYHQSIESDAALERRFQPVMVKEPTVAETTEILMGLRQRYEEHHQLTIGDDALTAAASLSARYISDRFLPDKAIDLIDEASSRVRLRHASRSAKKVVQQHLAMARQSKADALAVQDFEPASQARDQEIALEAELKFLTVEGEFTQENRQAPIVTADDIAEVVSASTGIPVNRLTDAESKQLLHLEETLHQFVIGQDAAVNATAKAIRRSRLGLKGLNRPIASFVFCGPTGVGKTELAKALAASVFGSVDAMVRLDMSEYRERQSVSKLIGSPPGYVGYGDGGQLTEPIRRQPYTLILLDEIEKAHPDVFNLLLQVLEDGRLTDAQGRVVNFQNTLIVMTSNLGAPTILKPASRLGFELLDQPPTAAHYALMQSQVTEALKLFFRPEFMNRLDDVIVFQSLSREDIKQVADLFLAEVATRLAERDIALEVPEAIKELLVAKGYDSAYGARPMRRAITRWVEDPLAEAILAGKLETGDTATLAVDDDEQIVVSAQAELSLAQIRR